MTYEHILCDFEDGILQVTLNRPKALNALSQALLDELRDIFANYAPSLDGLKGIVLTGAGPKSFVAGADISEFTSLDKNSGERMAQKGHDIFFLIERFPKPVVAAVNGFALGGGCELAMACHIRVASEKARFGQPEVNLGIIPGYGGTQRLVQLIGKGKALELLMTAEIISAEEAYRLGLANHLVAAGEEVGKARELINTIAQKAPIAIAKVIESVNAYAQDGVEGFAFEVEAFAKTVETDDFQEGARAFLEKRPAQFQGK